MNNRKSFTLKKSFFQRDTSLVARELLGKILVRKSQGKHTSGIIMETEAYYGTGDPASHACRGITPRSRLMFGTAGVAYVYLCYGVHWLLNVVTEEEGTPGAVLIRGIKPLEGIDEMKERRKTREVRRLTDGPGKLTVALYIDGRDNGSDMTDAVNGLYIAEDHRRKNDIKIKKTPRIGIREGKDRLLRYVAVGL
jgi:DNA-3-methyladenine glycosylase